jgi:predicted nucleotide-binding protein (sugar kinase/HSP70/actin superfamily)
MAIWRVRKELAAVKVDRSVVKPKVAIIGEFWAMTTEGDGNYHLQRFLESEGAEVDIQLMVNWILYLNWEVKYDTKVRVHLRKSDAGSKGIKGMNWRLILATTWLVDKVTRGVFYTVGRFMGLKGYRIPDMDELAKISHRFYNNEMRGGEGHMEVGKLIQNVVHNKVNMTVSVKPFGCMPSGGVSDGVQSIVTEMYPQAIFLPIETSGDGAVNVHSRVQMQLFKARQVAQQEVRETMEAYGLTEELVREVLERHPHLNHSFHYSPHRAGCTAADLIHEVGRKLGRRCKTPELATAE